MVHKKTVQELRGDLTIAATHIQEARKQRGKDASQCDAAMIQALEKLFGVLSVVLVVQTDIPQE